MRAAFEEVMEIRGEELSGDGEVEITGADPVFSTRFKIGETCASVLAGASVRYPNNTHENSELFRCPLFGEIRPLHPQQPTFLVVSPKVRS